MVARAGRDRRARGKVDEGAESREGTERHGKVSGSHSAVAVAARGNKSRAQYVHTSSQPLWPDLFAATWVE